MTAGREVARATTDMTVRSYEDRDEPAVLELLSASLGGGPAGRRPVEFFRWKHLANPFGGSYMLVAESEGRIVGLRAFMRWRFGAGDRRFRAVRAVDTATHPDHQGRGIFSTLTRRALEDLRGETDFVFNTPNEKSLPGYLKMGWQQVGKIPIFVRVRRPLRFGLHAASWRRGGPTEVAPSGVFGVPAQDALRDPALQVLLDGSDRPSGLGTARSLEYLGWRYGEAPLLDYRAFTTSDGASCRGLAIFRVRPRGALTECTVAELITRPKDVAGARRLLRGVARGCAADHLTCTFPRDSTAMAAARRAGFVRAPGGMTLTVNMLGHDLTPDPSDLSTWALSVGDVEVF